MKPNETLAQQEFLAARKRRRKLISLLRVLVLFAFLALWELSARLGLINDFIFSSPSRVILCFSSMILDGSIIFHTGITLWETLLSFFFVTAFGILGGLLLWSAKGLSEVLDPYLVMLNSLPKSALAPILIVWLGTGTRTIVIAAVSVAVFGSVLTLHNGFQSVDPDQVRLIYSLGGTRRDVLIKVLLPGSVPLIVNNMKVNIGLCLVGVIIGEFLAANQGLGYPIIYGSQVFKLDMVMMSIVILCIVSAVLYKAVAWLEKKTGRMSAKTP